jgi:serine/threonine kinase PknH
VDEVVFGRYRLIEVIGEGGMGTVYRARDTTLRREVAVKVLPTELAAQPGYRQRFEREAFAAAQLTEPHIIPIHDAGEVDGRLYLVMPVIAGVDVASVLERDGPMSPERAVKVVEQLASALGAAHAAGLVHRDVKPSNALVTGDEFVYLIDFGIAHDASATKLTRTGSIVGTFAYMAPERFSTGTADVRADVYALACVLYECLTGYQPYPGESLEQQVAGHLTAVPPRPSLHNAALPAGFDEVIARGMAKDPDQRYQSAPQLAVAARQALTPTPWSAVPEYAPSLGPLPGQLPTLLGAPALAPTLPRYPGAGVFPGPGVPRRSRARWLVGGGAAAALVIAAVVVAVIALRPHPTAVTTQSTSAHSAPASSAPQVAPADLDPILLSAADVNAVMGTSGMQAGQIGHTTWTAQATLSNPDCAGALFAAQTSVYQGSGDIGISAEGLQEPDKPVHTVTQAAVSFPSADLALAFVKTSAGKWRACAGQTITLTYPNGQKERVTVGNLVGDVPAITQLHTTEGFNGFACQLALRAVLNVVLDVYACGPQVSDQASRIAEKMADNATRQAH